MVWMVEFWCFCYCTTPQLFSNILNEHIFFNLYGSIQN